MSETLVLAYGFIYNKCIKNTDKLFLCRTSDGLPYYASYIVELRKKILKFIDEDKEEEIVEFIEKINKDAINKHLEKIRYAQTIGKGRGVSIGWQFVFKSSESYLFADDFPIDNGKLYDVNDDKISAIDFLQLLKSISEEKNISINDLLQILGLQSKIFETDKSDGLEENITVLEDKKPKKKTKKEVSKPDIVEENTAVLEDKKPKKKLLKK